MNRLLIRLLKAFIRRFARYHDFIDPIDLLARLTRFGQPSEVAVPTELLRAGARMHARGLLNSQAIQYNLDWIWPFWVNRQFDPHDESFVPRAFSLTHINLTHRNWTSVGLPDRDCLAVVDPGGLVTPFRDGWSLDCWVQRGSDAPRSPGEAREVDQNLELEGTPAVRTRVEYDEQSMESRVRLTETSGFDRVRPSRGPRCVIEASVESEVEGWFCFALRPYNPEGISTVDSLEVDPDLAGWTVEDESRRSDVLFATPPDRHVLSDYDGGDVSHRFPDPDASERVDGSLGMVNAAASYRLESGERSEFRVEIPLEDDSSTPNRLSTRDWETVLEGSCELSVPDERIEFLFESSRRTLLSLSNEAVYPGSFTYKRFWFRDASYMLNALLVLGYPERVRKILDTYPSRQKRNGYFCSQKGEWDANGQVLWILERYRDVTNEPLPDRFEAAIRSGAEWILHKRLDDDLEEPHAGLLPPGFSAEHFGPNDYYYWDDFWSVAGLRAASNLLDGDGERFAREARFLKRSVETSLRSTANGRDDRAMPPSPYRNVDAGSVGSLAAGYPLQLYSSGDDRLIDTARALREDSFVNGAFFQEMIHSGLNPYLSLHVAQVLLRAGEEGFWPIVRSVADLASPTGKWPEAVHPRTGGGCMGDGEHGWAAADWVLMVRNLFLREEGSDRLLLGEGLPEEWLESGEELSVGPTGTSFGTVRLDVLPREAGLCVEFESDSSARTPVVELNFAGYESETERSDRFETVLEAVESP